MQWIVVDDYGALSRVAARQVAQRLLARPRLVLALPTGETPLGLYQELVRLYKEGLLDFSRATAFNLDEFLDIPPEHPASFRSYMERHFWSQVNLRPEARHIPHSSTPDPEEECRRYEALIQEAGGLDLVILGIGKNGHIAFNEPGTPFHSRTHVVELTAETRQHQAQFFGGLENVPKRAITMGIRTIMNAQEILVLVAGWGKAGILARALEGPVSPEVPASVLQLHPRLTVVADRAAAAVLRE
ncbi:MAG: glucosamine-6-phosphate deaminase [Candidatus Bipolaricaulaceae bacterium]